LGLWRHFWRGGGPLSVGSPNGCRLEDVRAGRTRKRRMGRNRVESRLVDEPRRRNRLRAPGQPALGNRRTTLVDIRGPTASTDHRPQTATHGLAKCCAPDWSPGPFSYLIRTSTVGTWARPDWAHPRWTRPDWVRPGWAYPWSACPNGARPGRTHPLVWTVGRLTARIGGYQCGDDRQAAQRFTSYSAHDHPPVNAINPVLPCHGMSAKSAQSLLLVGSAGARRNI
jgi:hypothetical protein